MKNKLILSVLAIAVVLSSCGDKQSQAKVRGLDPYPIQKVFKQDAIVYQEYSANLEGQKNVEIRPKVSGFIEKIYVDEGQSVKKGQILFKLETETTTQQADAAKAAINIANVEVNRLIPLVERKIISNVTLETAKANLAKAKADYKSIYSNIKFATVISPVDGVIGGIPHREGSLVSSTITEPLTIVSDIHNIRAYFTMNEKQMLQFDKMFKGTTIVDKIKKLPEVELILADNTVYEHKGKIEAIQGLINSKTGSTRLRAGFVNPKLILRSGGSGTIRIPIEKKNVILLPQNAVYEMQGKHMVYTVGKDNKVKSKIVQISGTLDLKYIVTAGVEAGELVVVEGANKLVDGREIVPQELTKNTVHKVQEKN